MITLQGYPRKEDKRKENCGQHRKLFPGSLVKETTKVANWTEESMFRRVKSAESKVRVRKDKGLVLQANSWEFTSFLQELIQCFVLFLCNKNILRNPESFECLYMAKFQDLYLSLCLQVLRYSSKCQTLYLAWEGVSAWLHLVWLSITRPAYPKKRPRVSSILITAVSESKTPYSYSSFTNN